MTNLIIVGAGGFGLEVAAYAQDITQSRLQALTLTGFLDDTKGVGTLHRGVAVLGTLESPIEPDALYVIAIGATENRKMVADKLAARGARFATLLHPAAYVADSARLGEGTIMAPFSFAGPACEMGRHGLLNIYASMAHESRAGDCVTLSPYAGTHACAVLEDGVFLGAHAVVTKDVRIGANAKLAAGAVAYNDVPQGANALGNPARFRV